METEVVIGRTIREALTAASIRQIDLRMAGIPCYTSGIERRERFGIEFLEVTLTRGGGTATFMFWDEVAGSEL